jgi:hypothetical protein
MQSSYYIAGQLMNGWGGKWSKEKKNKEKEKAHITGDCLIHSQGFLLGSKLQSRRQSKWFW